MSALSRRRLLAWLRLLAANRRMQVSLRAFLRIRGTTLPRFDVMAALHRWGGALSMSELSRLLLVSNGNTTAVVIRLEADGFVRRASSAADKRTVIVRLTPKGGASFERLLADHEAEVDRLLAGLEEADIDALTGVLERVAPGADRPPPLRRRFREGPR